MSQSTQSSALTPQSFSEGDWIVVHPQKTLGKVIESVSLWGKTSFRVWLPASDSIIRVDASALSPAQSSVLSTHHLAYLAAAARVADALTREDMLLAPIESSVIPLPHQIRALSRAIANDRVRYLLADEVGLGKTIEAGLIMRELKLRGRVKRTLVIAPKGLVTQWIAEMAMHFNEPFHSILSEDYKILKRISATHRTEGRGLRTEKENNNSVLSTQSSVLRAANPNPFRAFNQVVVSMDSVKPPSSASGAARERFEDLILAGWDLVIVDEAHRLGGSTDQVARYKLGRGLSDAAPYLLLLSATPHQGKTDAFHRLVSLIDQQAFPDVGSVSRERVRPYVIRTEKRHAIDAEGNPLFKPRITELAPVSWEKRHREQELLYEAVTQYVRIGYNQAMREKRSYFGFLMILMQRLVVSSTRAIRATLEKRLEALQVPDEQLSLFHPGIEDDWIDLDAQEQLETLLRSYFKGLKNERDEVKRLLETATRCEQLGPDAKAEALLEWIYKLQAQENDPELKVLVFTEFVSTQEMLYTFLAERGFRVVCLNGSMDLQERKRAQEAFARDARILISTDAGGEGLNLQFCHVVINYDIPWNPMRLEQRIGRVDRIGQKHIVRAVNFVFQNSVEHRVLEVLEQKLAIIFDELGIDKTGDVLDSAQAGSIFDELYVEAILNPEQLEETVESVFTRLQEQARQARESASVLDASESLNPQEAQWLLTHPLPHWVERMTVSYLQAHHGKAERQDRVWELTWPDGETYSGVVFTGKEAEAQPAAQHLTLEQSRVRELAMRIPEFIPGQPIPVITLPGIAAEIIGFWSLWRIAIAGQDWKISRIMPLFVSENDKVYMQTAQHIWDQLLSSEPVIRTHLDAQTSQNVFEQLQGTAEVRGKPIYEALLREHRARIAREREKADYAFAARRNAIERIGLPEVRNYRLSLLVQEEKALQEELDRREQAYPEMVPLLLIRVEGNRE